MLSYLSNGRMWKQLEILTLGPGYLKDRVLGHNVEIVDFLKVTARGLVSTLPLSSIEDQSSIEDSFSTSTASVSVRF
jgi:hypothetical protein